MAVFLPLAQASVRVGRMPTSFYRSFTDNITNSRLANAFQVTLSDCLRSTVYMKKLSKIQIKERDDHAVAIRNARADLDQALAECNEAVKDLHGKVTADLIVYNETVDAAREWRDNLVSEMDNYISDHSDKWQESDAGSEYQGWKDEWDGVELDELTLNEPDELELENDGDAASALEELPEEPR